MGRHKIIESTFLRELALGEERAERALRVIQHQQKFIAKLEQDLIEQTNLYNELYEKDSKKECPEEYYKDIQAEVLLNRLQESLIQIKDIQILRRHEYPIQISQMYSEDEKVSNASSANNITDQLQSDNNFINREDEPEIIRIRNSSSHYSGTSANMMLNEQEAFINQLEPYLEHIRKDIDNIKKGLKSQVFEDAYVKRKNDSLRRKVKWLKGERDEVMIFLKDISDWRKRVEGLLLDLISSELDVNPEDNENDAIITKETRNKWQTARKFFSADQAHFILSD